MAIEEHEDTLPGETEEQPQTAAEAFATPTADVPSSVRDRLRAQRQEVQRQKWCDITIPGYDGELVARYRLVDGEELEKVGSRLRHKSKNQADRLVNGSMDTLIMACEGFYVRSQRDDQLYPIQDETGEIMRYDDRLAEFLNFPAESARDVVRGVFGNNEMAIVQHNAKFSAWLADTSRDPDEPINLLGD